MILWEQNYKKKKRGKTLTSFYMLYSWNFKNFSMKPSFYFFNIFIGV